MNKAQLVDILNTNLETYNSDCMEYQRIRKVIIVKDEWTNENGLLTPTLKMKRNALSSNYETALERLYYLDETVSWE